MTKKCRSMSLSSRGARTHFGIAIALISVIPSLTLFYLYSASAGDLALSWIQWIVAGFGVVGAMLFGYVLMGRYPATIIRLRTYLHRVIRGNMPDAIDLSADEQDIAVIEEALNRMLKMLSEKLHDAQLETSHLQDELFQSQKLEAIGTLAGGVAHEINNPINGIMNYAQLILDELGPDSPVAEFAVEIGKETQRVSLITTNLLSFSRQEDQAHSPEHISDIVEATLSLMRAVMSHDQITLQVAIPKALPLVMCRSQQIQQVIMNLLANARDAVNETYANDDENKIIRVTACLIERKGRQYVRTTVEDHGPGIPETIQKRIFDPFYTTKSRDKGTGLGLSISHGIVKDHGGKLSVETLVGAWTRFHIDLPVLAVPADEVMRSAHAGARETQE